MDSDCSVGSSTVLQFHSRLFQQQGSGGGPAAGRINGEDG